VNRRGFFRLGAAAAVVPALSKQETPLARADFGEDRFAVDTAESIAYRIDARGMSADVIERLPEILRTNNEKLKADILDILRRQRRPLGR
jgi:hypothetical protein